MASHVVGQIVLTSTEAEKHPLRDLSRTLESAHGSLSDVTRELPFLLTVIPEQSVYPPHTPVTYLVEPLRTKSILRALSPSRTVLPHAKRQTTSLQVWNTLVNAVCIRSLPAPEIQLLIVLRHFRLRQHLSKWRSSGNVRMHDDLRRQLYRVLWGSQPFECVHERYSCYPNSYSDPHPISADCRVPSDLRLDRQGLLRVSVARFFYAAALCLY
jgi:hypothetical protein